MPDAPDAIPYARFQELTVQHAAAEKRATAAEAALEKARGQFESSIATVQEQVTAKDRELASVRLQHDMDRTLLADGIADAGVVDYLRFKFNNIETAEGEEAQGFGDWFASYKEGKPALLQSFMKQAENAAPPPAPVPTPPPGPRKASVPPIDTSNNGRTGANGAVSAITPESLAKMTPEQIKQMGGMDAIIAQAIPQK